MKALFGMDELLCAYVCKQLGMPLVEGVAIGTEKDGQLAGAVVYHNYRGCDIEMLAASEGPWLDRGMLAVFFGYPFQQLGCARVTAVCDKRNKRARQFVEKVGFKMEGVHPAAIEGGTAITYGLLKDNCRWIHGQEEQRICAGRA